MAHRPSLVRLILHGAFERARGRVTVTVVTGDRGGVGALLLSRACSVLLSLLVGPLDTAGQGGMLPKMLPTLSPFPAACYRITPSLHRASRRVLGVATNS